MKKKHYSLAKITYCLMVLIIFSSYSLPVYSQAMSEEQKQLFEANILYLDLEEDAVSVNPSLGALTEAEIIKFPSFDTSSTINPTCFMLHWTGASGPGETVDSLVQTLNSRNLSVQFFIDSSGRVYQLFDEPNALAHHAPPYNERCIGVEINGTGTQDGAADWMQNNQVQKNAVARLAIYISQLYNIPLENNWQSGVGILSHHQLNGLRRDGVTKIDVGDRYLNDIMSLMRSGPSSPGGVNDVDPNSLPALRRTYPEQLENLPDNHKQNVETGRTMATERGWGDGNNWLCLYDLWYRESSWNELAKNPDSTAFGIPQSMLSVHRSNIDANYPGYYNGNYNNPSGGDAAVQIRWGLDYIDGRYQNPCEAIVHHNARNWY